jgi:hypothetical protein
VSRGPRGRGAAADGDRRHGRRDGHRRRRVHAPPRPRAAHRRADLQEDQRLHGVVRWRRPWQGGGQTPMRRCCEQPSGSPPSMVAVGAPTHTHVPTPTPRFYFTSFTKDVNTGEPVTLFWGEARGRQGRAAGAACPGADLPVAPPPRSAEPAGLAQVHRPALCEHHLQASLLGLASNCTRPHLPNVKALDTHARAQSHDERPTQRPGHPPARPHPTPQLPQHGERIFSEYN